MGKRTICIGEHKDADQHREADERLCFRYSDKVQFLFYLMPKFQASSSFFVLVQAGLCRTCSETTLLVFPRGVSVVFKPMSFIGRISVRFAWHCPSLNF